MKIRDDYGLRTFLLNAVGIHPSTVPATGISYLTKCWIRVLISFKRMRIRNHASGISVLYIRCALFLLEVVLFSAQGSHHSYWVRLPGVLLYSRLSNLSNVNIY
jgi:hypothetical protein